MLHIRLVTRGEQGVKPLLENFRPSWKNVFDIV